MTVTTILFYRHLVASGTKRLFTLNVVCVNELSLHLFQCLQWNLTTLNKTIT